MQVFQYYEWEAGSSKVQTLESLDKNEFKICIIK